jgi:hypothetical protein
VFADEDESDALVPIHSPQYKYKIGPFVADKKTWKGSEHRIIFFSLNYLCIKNATNAAQKLKMDSKWDATVPFVSFYFRFSFFFRPKNQKMKLETSNFFNFLRHETQRKQRRVTSFFLRGMQPCYFWARVSYYFHVLSQ